MNCKPFAYATVTMEDGGELRRMFEEARRLREEAEELTEESQPQTQQYPAVCHSLNLAIQAVTDRSLTTQDGTINPTSQISPQRIIPLDDFAMRQEEIWVELLIGELFSSQPAFPS
jgi:hypothetical protein